MWEFLFPTSSLEEYIYLTHERSKTPNFMNKTNVNWGYCSSDYINSFNPLPNTTMLTQTPSTLFNDDLMFDTGKLGLKNFAIIPSKSAILTFDKSYTNAKFLVNIVNDNTSNTYNTNQNMVQPTSYTQTLNSFRSNSKESLLMNNSSLRQFLLTPNNTHTITKEGVRLLNPIKTRSPAKNSIVTYNAMQKVFKSRFDEGRSNSRLEDISNSLTPKLFISATRAVYEGLLGKNTESFFNPSLYNKHLLFTYSDTISIGSTLNMYLVGVPFLLSEYSDPSRHIWVD